MRGSRIVQLISTTAVAALALGVASSSADPTSTQACNLRGSWVASAQEANRYMQALNPTSTAIALTSGSLTATFTRTTFTFGGVGLHLTGQLGRSMLREEVDIDASAPYRVRGSRLALGKGTYKIVYVNAKLTQNGRTTTLRLPNSSIATPPSSLPYSCTPSVLRLTITPGGTGSRVTLPLRRER